MEKNFPFSPLFVFLFPFSPHFFENAMHLTTLLTTNSKIDFLLFFFEPFFFFSFLLFYFHDTL